jgi:hypothetical protein
MYWALREAGFDNIESEQLIAKYKKWYLKANGEEEQELIG